MFIEDRNTIKELSELRSSGGSNTIAWRSLQGDKSLSSKYLENLEVTSRLGQIGAGDLVKARVSVGDLAKLNDQRLIFMIDEMEELQNVNKK